MKLAKFERLSRREQAGLAGALLLVFAAAVDNFAARPIVRAIKALNAQIGIETRSLAYNQGVLRLEDETAQAYDAIRQRVGVAASHAEAIAEFKGQIDVLARQTGVSILKMNHREPGKTGADTAEEYYVDIGAFEADIKNVIRFLREMWQAPGVVRVVKVSMVPGGSKDMVKGSMSITKLMLKDLPTAAAAGGEPPLPSPN